MKRRDEYWAKITNESGLTRGRVPCPLLQILGARPGNQLVFRLTDSNQVTLRIERTRNKPKRKGR